MTRAIRWLQAYAALKTLALVVLFFRRRTVYCARAGWSSRTTLDANGFFSEEYMSYYQDFQIEWR